MLSPVRHPGLTPAVPAGTVPTGASWHAVTLTSMRADAVSMAAAVAAISLSTRSPSSSCLTSSPLGRSSWGRDGTKGTDERWHSSSSGAHHSLTPSHRPFWGTHLPDGADPAQAGSHRAAVGAFHRPWVLQGAEVAHSLTAALLAHLQQTCVGSTRGRGCGTHTGTEMPGPCLPQHHARAGPCPPQHPAHPSIPPVPAPACPSILAAPASCPPQHPACSSTLPMLAPARPSPCPL